MDPAIIDVVSQELFADFMDEPYTDKDELDMWKYLLNRLI